MISQSGNQTNAIDKLKPIEARQGLFETYYLTYADILLKEKHYRDAIVMYNKASFYTSEPEMFLKAGICYENTGQYQNAEIDYLTAKYIEPNRLIARMALLKLYLRIKDNAKAIEVAQEIRAIQPKIASKQALYYKDQANLVLRKYGIVNRMMPFSANDRTPSLKLN